MKEKTNDKNQKPLSNADTTQDPSKESKKHKKTKEIGGPKGLEPTRYGDWERKGIAVDF